MRARGHNARLTPAKSPATAKTRSAGARSELASAKEYGLLMGADSAYNQSPVTDSKLTNAVQ
jgi:hypothetical protein